MGLQAILKHSCYEELQHVDEQKSDTGESNAYGFSFIKLIKMVGIIDPKVSFTAGARIQTAALQVGQRPKGGRILPKILCFIHRAGTSVISNKRLSLR
ncbi:hypothetical protein SCA6_001751 [Theobroma cacao]